MHAPARAAALALLVPALAAAQSPTPAPAPATTTRSIPARSIPARAIARAIPAVIVLDMNGDGVNLDGMTRTSLLTGGPVGARWTTAGSDDAFLVLDATSLRAATNVSVMNSSGEPLEGMQLFRDGLRIRQPGETNVRGITTDGWQMLAALDANGDGKINVSDPAWASLKLFIDRNADGTISPGELTALAEARIDAVQTRIDAQMADLSARAAATATFTTADGQTRSISSTSLTP